MCEGKKFVVNDDADKHLPTDDQHTFAMRALFDHLYTSHPSVLVTADVPPEYFRDEQLESAYRRSIDACRSIKF